MSKSKKCSFLGLLLAPLYILPLIFPDYTLMSIGIAFAASALLLSLKCHSEIAHRFKLAVVASLLCLTGVSVSAMSLYSAYGF